MPQDQPTQFPPSPASDRPQVVVELAVFTVRDSDLKLLLRKQVEPPFAGRWALPGDTLRVGPQDQGEDLDVAARRALQAQPGLAGGPIVLEQIGAFGKPGRDPRQRVISVAWFALVPAHRLLAAPEAETRWVPCSELPPLAFDHGDIVDSAIDRLRRRLDEGDLAFALLPETFTVAELREVFEAVFGATYDPANFRRRFKRLLEEGVVVQAPGRRQTRSKPAAVYRASGVR